MENTNDIGKIIAALLVGAAIGGALGILYAPNKGAKTRKKLQASGTDVSLQIKEQLASLMEQLSAKQAQVAKSI